MLFVFDQNFNVIHVTSDPADFISGTALEQINGEHSCTIEIPWTSTTQKHFKEFNHIGFMIDGRFEVYTIRQILDIKDGFAQREIYCEHLSYELTKDIVEDRRIDKGPASDIITRILSDTDWKVGEIAELGNQTYNAYYINHRKALYEIAEIYGGELRFRIELNENRSAIANKYVDLLPTRGTDTGIRFLFNRNLKKIERETDTLEVFTALIGRGYSPETENGGQQRRIQFTDIVWSKASGDPVDKPKGQNWVGHPEAIAKYGMIRGVYEDESETPEELLANTWASLQNQCEPTYTYKADLLFIKDLMKEYLGEDGDTVLRLGDHFIIVDDEIGMEISTRIIGIEYDLLDIANSTVTMGQFYKTLGDKSDYDKLQSQIDSIRDTINGNEDIVFDDESFPDTVPPKSTVTAEGLFASIKLSWTYENKTYYEYALYASQTKGFAPAQQNLIFRGHASSFLHSVKPDQTWYYRVCAYNTHGQRNEFSEEVSAHSAKIANAEDYIEHASIGSALIGSLNADVINSGKIKAQHIEMKGVSVTDGNGTKTLDIDSAGQVSMNVSSLKIKNNSVATESFVSTAKNEAINSANDTINATIANYYTKTETNSQIDIAKDAVTTSVSNLRNEVMNATYTNLLENSDFLILDSGFPRGYSSYTFGDSEVRISDWVLQGAKAIKITSSGQTERRWVALFSPFIKTIEGQPFTASAWVATSSVSGIDAGCVMEIEWFNDTDRIATASYPFTPQTDDTWERVAVTGWSPTGTTRARVRISVQQNGILYTTKLMLQAGITATAWTRGGDFETITTRIATAEQKITDESITNTVKQNFYTKTETENAITSKDYATKSEVQQTANNITYKFSQSGGYNLVRNGNPKPNNYRHWWISSNANWYLNNATDIGIQTASTNEAYAGTATFKVQPGTAYSVSCWLMAEVNTKGTDVYFIGSANDDGAYTEIHHIYTGSGDGVWRQAKGTFTVGSNINYGFIRVDNNGRKDTSIVNYNVVFFSEVQMVKGSECYPQWSPNPNEVYDGITTIDKDGITVSQSNINTKTTMNASGFYINKNGQGDVFKVDENGLAITGKVTSNEVIMANGGMYTGQAVRGTNTNGFVVVGSSGDTTFRSDAGQVYLQTNDEVKVTAPSNPNVFKNLRSNNIYANNDFYATRDATINRNLNVNGEIVAVGSLTSNSNVHLGNNGLVNIRWGYGVVRVNASGQPLYLQCNDEVKCTKPADPSTYTSLRAYNLMAQNKVYANGVALTSSRDKKKNVEVYEESALQQILQTKIYRYHLLDDLDEEMKRIGIILQEAPVDAIDIEGVGVDLYQMVAMSWKAIQELKQEIDKREALESRVEELEARLARLERLLETNI